MIGRREGWHDNEVTASMTPSGPPPQPPAQPPGGPGTPVSGPPAAFAGFGKPPLDGATAVHDPVREVRTGVLVALAVAVLGLLLGLAWFYLAPKIPLYSDGKAVYLRDSEGEQSIAGDGWFALLGAAFGVVTAVGVAFRCRRGGIAVVLGLAAGGLLGSLLAWRFGIWLGPNQDVLERAKEVGAGKTFSAPLRLQAKAALLTWPFMATLVHLALTAIFGPRAPRPVWQSWAPLPPGPAAPSATED